MISDKGSFLLKKRAVGCCMEYKVASLIECVLTDSNSFNFLMQSINSSLAGVVPSTGHCSIM